MTRVRYGVKITYPSGRKKIVGNYASRTGAMEHKILLMEKTHDDDTEYEIVSLESNPAPPK